METLGEYSLFFRILLSWDSTESAPVSFNDPEGISHAVDVTAATLYEAAALAVAEFRRVGLFEVHIGPGTRLRVAVKQ
jgi:hypothetical protein